MQAVQRLDNAFIALTFSFSSLSPIFPRTSKMMGSYGDDRLVVASTPYAWGLGFSSLPSGTTPPAKHRLVSPTCPSDEINMRRLSCSINPLIYSLSLIALTGA